MKKYNQLIVWILYLLSIGFLSSVAIAQTLPEKFIVSFRQSDGKYGFVNERHCWVIPPKYDLAGYFGEDGIASVTVGGDLGILDGKVGFVDKRGNLIIEPQFDNDRGFSNGLAAVLIKGKWGFIDKAGKVIINPQFEDAWGFYDDLASVKIGGKWGFINKAGKITINPQFDGFPMGFSEGLARVLIGRFQESSATGLIWAPHDTEAV